MPRSRACSLLMTLLLTCPAIVGAPPTAPSPPLTDSTGDPLPEGVVARLGSLRWRDGSSQLQLTLSPDGKFIAFTSQLGDIRILDAAIGRETRRFHRDDEPFRPGVTFSPDGKLLAAIDDGDRLHVWDFASGKQRSSFRAGRNATWPIFSKDGNAIATICGGPGGAVFVWDASTGKQLARVTPVQSVCNGASLSPDGAILATWGVDMPSMFQLLGGSGNSSLVQLWDVKTGKGKNRLKGSKDFVAAAAFSPDSKKVAVLRRGTESCRLDIANADSGQGISGIQSVDGDAERVAFLPDGKAVATMGHALTLWDIATGRQLRRGPRGPTSIHALVFLGDRVLACGPSEQCIRLWEPLGGKELSPTQGHHGRITALAFPLNGHTITSIDSARNLITWDIVSARSLRQAHVRNGSVDELFGDSGGASVLTPDGKHLVMKGAAGIVIRELTEKQGGRFHETQLLPSERYYQFAISFSADGDAVAVAASGLRADSSICVASVRSHQVLHRLSRAESYLTAVAVSADLSSVAVESLPNDFSRRSPASPKVAVWNLSTGQQISEFKLPAPPGETERKDALAFSGDGRSLLVAGPGGAVAEWDVATGKQVRVLGSEPGWQPQSLLLSRDGNTLTVGMQSTDTGRGKVQLWEARTGGVRAEFGGHEGEITYLGFSRDERLLASGSSDTTILVCDVTGAGRGGLATRLDTQAAEQLWADLASANTRRAYRAIWRLRAAPADAIGLLRSSVKPAAGRTAGPDEISRLIRNLDAARFAVREQAVRDLRSLGAQVKEPLRRALSRASSPETRKRIEELLAGMESNRPVDNEIRDLRAVEVLEAIGNTESKHLLEALGHGSAEARLTAASKAALQRLTPARDAGALAEKSHSGEDEGVVHVGIDPAAGSLPAGALLRLGTTRYRQPRSYAAAMSPDGRLVAVGDFNGVRLMEVATGNNMAELKAPEGWTGFELAFSPDGRFLAGASIGEGTIIWELATKKQLAKTAGNSSRLPGQKLIFSADGRTLAVAAEGIPLMGRGNVEVWRTTTGKHLHTFSDSAKGCDEAALSPDGKLLATCGGVMSGGLSDLMNPTPRRSVYFWDVATGKELRHVDIWARMLNSLAFAPDGKSLAVCSDMEDIRVLDPETGKENRVIHADAIGHGALYYSPDGKLLVVVAEGQIRTWEIATGQEREPCRCPPCRFNSLAFTKNGIVACGTWGHSVRVWHVPSGKELSAPGGHFGQLASLAFRQKGRQLVSSGSTGELCLWDLSSGQGRLHDPERSASSLREREEEPTCVVTPDGKFAVRAVGLMKQFRCQEIDTGNIVSELETNLIISSGTRFSRDGRLAVTAGQGRHFDGSTVVCWDTTNGRVLHEFSLKGHFPAAALSADGKRIAIYDTDRVTLFDTQSGKKLGKSLAASYGFASGFAISPDGESIAVLSNEGNSVVVCDATAHHKKRELPWVKENSKQSSLSREDGVCLFSDDGRALAFAAMDDESGVRSRIAVWEIASGAVRAEFTGHAGNVSSLAFSPDGRLLASGGADTTILVWDLTGLGRRAAPALSSQQADALWPDLASKDARRAYQTMWRLIGAPAEAIRMLEGKLKPAHAAAAADLREIRACEILERIGNDSARRLLESLAKGAADGGITREARGSLQRLIDGR